MTTDALLTALVLVACSVVLYAYVLFPVAVGTLFLRSPRRAESPEMSEDPPDVTMIVPAYNEEAVIEAKLRNASALDWPRDRLEVLVVSDASTDRTNEIARSFQREGVHVLAQERRRGKSAGLNRAFEVARGEVVVLTDANALHPPDTVRALVRHFHDPRVGMVTGYTRYTVGADGNVTQATNAYTSLERRIKRAESTVGCCVGADGAVFAIRRHLFRPLREDDINDLVIPLDVIEQGYECRFADDVFCTENSGKSLESEFRRQSRITNRTLRALWRHRRLLNPRRRPLFALFLASHKVVRMFVPLLLLVAAIAGATLAIRLAKTVETITATAIVLGTIAAFVAASEIAPAVVRPLVVFGAVNLAMLHGWWKCLSGQRDTVWQHVRADERVDDGKRASGQGRPGR